MSLRSGESLADQVSELMRANDELKTAQFTSQNSGMKFRQAEDLTGTIDLIINTGYGESVYVISNHFIPEHQRPAICLPHFSFDTPPGYRADITHDYERNYVSILLYDSNDALVAYLDILEFYHQANVSEGYKWDTVVYAWSSAVLSVPFTIELRATDSGSHELNIESWEL